MLLTIGAAAIAFLLVTAFSVNTNSMNVNALDIREFANTDDIGQSVECVIAVVGCDGTGSVGSSGDTIIGSNNGISNTNEGNGNEPTRDAPLVIFKNIECESTGGMPSDESVCDYINDNVSPSDFRIIVSGNNPNPSILSGSSSGIGVEIGEGPYTISENSSINSDITDALDLELSTTALTTFSPSYSGDCSGEAGMLEATGSISEGERQTCVIINLIRVTGGTVPDIN